MKKSGKKPCTSISALYLNPFISRFCYCYFHTPKKGEKKIQFPFISSPCPYEVLIKINVQYSIFSVSQSRHYWHLESTNSLLLEASLCIQDVHRHSRPLLTRCTLVALSKSGQLKISSDFAKYSLWTKFVPGDNRCTI